MDIALEVLREEKIKLEKDMEDMKLNPIVSEYLNKIKEIEKIETVIMELDKNVPLIEKKKNVIAQHEKKPRMSTKEYINDPWKEKGKRIGGENHFNIYSNPAEEICQIDGLFTFSDVTNVLRKYIFLTKASEKNGASAYLKHLVKNNKITRIMGRNRRETRYKSLVFRESRRLEDINEIEAEKKRQIEQRKSMFDTYR